MQIEAMDLQDWERQDKGLPPLPKKKIVRKPIEMPEVENLLKFKDVPLDRFEKLVSARRNTIKNAEGARFIGYDVIITLKGNKKPGRPLTLKEGEEPQKLESKTISGWMQEGEWLELYRHIRDRIDLSRIGW